MTWREKFRDLVEKINNHYEEKTQLLAFTTIFLNDHLQMYDEYKEIVKDIDFKLRKDVFFL